MLLVPFTAGGEVLGALRAVTSAPDRFEFEEEGLVLHVSYLVSGWLVRRRLEARLERSPWTARKYSERLELISSSSEDPALATTEDEVFRVLGRTVPDIMPFDRMFSATVSPDESKPSVGRLTADGLVTKIPLSVPFERSASRAIMEGGAVVHVQDLPARSGPDVRAIEGLGMRSPLERPHSSGRGPLRRVDARVNRLRTFDTEDLQVLICSPG